MSNEGHAGVLVVEDHAATARALKHLFDFAGLPAVVAATGEAALAYLRAAGPSSPAVVLDLMLPGVTGVDVLRAIRGDPRLAHVRVVVYTAAHEVAVLDECRALGAAAVVAKGGTGFDALLDVVYAVVRPAAAGAA